MKRSVFFLVVCQVGAMSLWFSAAATTVPLAQTYGLSPADLAVLTTSTQLGFVVGALGFAALGIPDRFDPRRVFAVSALVAAAANLALLVVPPDTATAVASRAALGAALAGVYPVGMKIAVGWSLARRGFLVGLLVGALTLGSALPHLFALLGGSNWRAVLVATSLGAAASALAIFLVGLGPHHQKATAFRPSAIMIVWRDRRILSAYLGYFGHMWELYAFWAWVGTLGAFAATAAGVGAPQAYGSAIAFVAIALGGLVCVPAGLVADKIGKATVARVALACGAGAGVVAAITFGEWPILFAVALIVWGAAIIPDSAQFSALVADAAPPDYAGSIMTLQNAIGFSLSAVSVQLTPVLADHAGWPTAILVLLVGPMLGFAALSRRFSGRLKA